MKVDSSAKQVEGAARRILPRRRGACRRRGPRPELPSDRASSARSVRNAPIGEQLELRSDRVQPVDARAALARALVGEVARDRADSRSGTRPGAGRSRHRRRAPPASTEAEVVGRNPPAEVTADQHPRPRLGRAPARRRRSPRRGAERDLAHARSGDGAAEGHQRGAGRAQAYRARNQSAPKRATSARWARVSAFWTRVGPPPRPRSDGHGGVRVGVGATCAGPRSALASPATNPSGPVRTRIGTRVAHGRAGRDARRPTRPVRARRTTTTPRGADGLGRRDDAVEHQVGREPEQDLVLAARRLALGAVRDDHAGSAACSDAAQLRGEWGTRRRPGRAGRRTAAGL